MLRPTVGVGLTRRAALAAIAVLALLALSAFVPGGARAAGCDDVWTNTAGGNWFEGANWSSKSPPNEGEEACISAAGTYTVTMTQAAEGVTVKALTIGGGSGTQTLAVGGACSPAPRLRTVAGISVEQNGELATVKSPACPGSARLAGPITNKGTIAVDENAEYSFGAATLLSEGALDIANGVQLLAGNEITVNNAAGTIASSGTGRLLVKGGTFEQGAGRSTGEPIMVENGTIDLAGHGAASIAALGSSTLKGSETLYKGQTLAVKGTCASGHGNLTRSGPLLNQGTIVLERPEVCDLQSNLHLGASRLRNEGLLKVESGPHIIEAENEVENMKTLSLAEAAELNIEGWFVETGKAVFDYGIGPAGDASMRAFGPSTIGGTLSLQVASGYVGALGHTFGLLGTPGYLGRFAKVTGATIKSKVEPGLYYRPNYNDLLAVLLEVAEATLSVTSGDEVLPGATVKLFGSYFPGKDPVKLSFQDAKKTKTTFASVTSGWNGGLLAEVTIPAGAAVGTGTFTAQDTVTGVKATATVKVI